MIKNQASKWISQADDHYYAGEFAKAIRLYEKAGFEKEGVLRKYSRMKNENIFLDEVMMSWLA